MSNLVLKDGKYYGYDTRSGRLYDLHTLKFLGEEKPEVKRNEPKKEELPVNEKPLEEEKETKKNK